MDSVALKKKEIDHRMREAKPMSTKRRKAQSPLVWSRCLEEKYRISQVETTARSDSRLYLPIIDRGNLTRWLVERSRHKDLFVRELR
jgi:hypothetical protein